MSENVNVRILLIIIIQFASNKKFFEDSVFYIY